MAHADRPQRQRDAQLGKEEEQGHAQHHVRNHHRHGRDGEEESATGKVETGDADSGHRAKSGGNCRGEDAQQEAVDDGIQKFARPQQFLIPPEGEAFEREEQVARIVEREDDEQDDGRVEKEGEEGEIQEAG